MTLKIAIFVSSLDNCGKRYPLDQICRHGKINHYLANNFIDELVFELKIAKNVKNTNWSPKLIFSMKKKSERFRWFLTYIENWLWKSNFGTFWQLPITPIFKRTIQLYAPKLIQDQFGHRSVLWIPQTAQRKVSLHETAYFSSKYIILKVQVILWTFFFSRNC